MRILTVPPDMAVLRTKSRPVKKIDAELMAFLRDLGKTLKHQKDPAGVGLSAIQVNRAIRVFAIFLPEQRKKEEGQPRINVLHQSGNCWPFQTHDPRRRFS